MRLFIAIDLPDNVKDYLYCLQRSFNKDNSKIIWVYKKNLHLTLKFSIPKTRKDCEFSFFLCGCRPSQDLPFGNSYHD